MWLAYNFLEVDKNKYFFSLWQTTRPEMLTNGTRARSTVVFL